MDKKCIRQSSYDWSESVLGLIHLARYFIYIIHTGKMYIIELGDYAQLSYRPVIISLCDHQYTILS